VWSEVWQEGVWQEGVWPEGMSPGRPRGMRWRAEAEHDGGKTWPGSILPRVIA
jgi:hypothetical protein